VAGFKNTARLKDFLAGKEELDRRVNAHLFKYSWIKSSYVGYEEYTFADFEAEVLQAIEHPHAHGNTVFEEHRREKAALLERYAFTDEIRAIARLAEIMVKWQDQRKNYTLFFVTLRHKVLAEVSRRSGMDFNLLRYIEGREIREVLQNRMSADALFERRKGCIVIYREGKNKGIVSGKEAIDFFKELSAVNVAGLTEVKGTPASLGTARGKARIVLSIADIATVQTGEILVTSMTRPEHMPAMKKAAAIVTDDGGITCHAAIVSRELKKPCVIGTKIGTKVFKTGDLVEVDAEKGVVRIVR
jgi:phosphohistidine swiveling domain-containing protein